VLNRSKSRDIAARIENQEGSLSKGGEVWQMNYADLKATHTFGDDQKVVPSTRELAAKVENNRLSYTFPAHSLTILHLRLE
jgi:alpha-L-arabinofuranosidase